MADARAEPRRRGIGIRGRITLVAAGIVTIALVLGAVLFWSVLRTSLLENVRASAEQDAATIVARIHEADDDRALSELEEVDDLDDDRFVQVVDEAGDVVATTKDGPEHPLAGEDDEGRSFEATIGGDAYLVAVEEADDHLVVVAGRSTSDVSETLATVAGLLAVAVPLVALLVAATTWLVVGRALAPVERMRRQVADVSATTLGRRLDEPRVDDEVGRLARTMNGMLDRLEDAQVAQRRFVSDASHELKSPLAALRQYAEVALRHPERVGRAELAEVVLAEGGRLERLVQGMLVLARADEGALRLDVREVDLDDLLLAESRRLRDTGRVAVDATGVAAARMHGDAGLLAQLVRNLVDNAARHARSRVALGVSMADAGGTAVLTVCDDGPGIPPAERERVFERFVRLDDARARDTGGSGLGLAIVREIATAHGGRVRIEDAAGGGACVRVELPADAG